MDIETLENTSDHNKIGNSKYDNFIMIFRPGCPPCRAALPEWNKLPKTYKNINIWQVNESNVDEISDNRPLNILGFPTFVFLPKMGEPDYYTGDRNVKAFEEWLNTKTKTPIRGGGKRRTRRTIRRRRTKRRTRFWKYKLTNKKRKSRTNKKKSSMYV